MKKGVARRLKTVTFRVSITRTIIMTRGDDASKRDNPRETGTCWGGMHAGNALSERTDAPHRLYQTFGTSDREQVEHGRRERADERLAARRRVRRQVDPDRPGQGPRAELS